ncbi:MAG: acylphosphatase [Pseudomonadota bacterium]
MVKRFHAVVTGRVQGVFFRATAREHARALEIQGFVQNLPDGSVELDAQGEEGLLRDLLHWCQHGPPGARVDNVEVDWKPPIDTKNGEFEIRH